MTKRVKRHVENFEKYFSKVETQDTGHRNIGFFKTKIGLRRKSKKINRVIYEKLLKTQ